MIVFQGYDARSGKKLFFVFQFHRKKQSTEEIAEFLSSYLIISQFFAAFDPVLEAVFLIFDNLSAL